MMSFVLLSLVASSPGIAQEEPLELDRGAGIGSISFSRDGGRLAYTCDEELRTISIDGKTRTKSSKVDEIYGWSPEGDRILCRIGDSELATVSVKDSRVARWKPSPRWRFVDWDEGGKLFLIYDQFGAWQHRRMKWDGAGERPSYDPYPPYVARSRDGKSTYFARWKGESMSDRRFRILRSDSSGVDPYEIALVDVGCFTDYVLLRLSPDESHLYLETQGTSGMMSDDPRAFAMVLSIDGKVRHALRIFAWAPGAGRALVPGKNGGVDILDVVRTERTTWITEPAGPVVVAPDLSRLAYVADGKLLIRSVP